MNFYTHYFWFNREIFLFLFYWAQPKYSTVLYCILFPGSALRHGLRCPVTSCWRTSEDVEPDVLVISCTRLLSVWSGFVFVSPQTKIVYLSRGRERTVNIKEAERARVRGVFTHCVCDEARATVSTSAPDQFGPAVRTKETFSFTDRREGPETFSLWEDRCPCLLLPLPIKPIPACKPCHVMKRRGGGVFVKVSIESITVLYMYCIGI